MELRRVHPSEFATVRQLLLANGWQHRIGTEAEFSGLLKSSQRAEVAILKGEIVGFARAISDGQSNGYLSMVVVSEAHRGKGIGRALVEHVMGEASTMTWVLRTGRPEAEEFFSKLGFKTSTVAMERLRVERDA